MATIVRPGEGLAAWLLIVNAFLLLYSHYLLKVVRETLILSNGSALDKSMANALSAITIGIMIFIYTLVYKKFQSRPLRYQLSVLVNGFFILNILMFIGLFIIDIRTPYTFYIWQSVYGVMVVSHFWSYCADLMNQKTGQRLFPLIMVGASSGAWLGSLSAEWVFNISGVNSIMIVALLCLVVATQTSKLSESCLPLSSQNTRETIEQAIRKIKISDGFRLVFTQKYLLLVAAFVFLMNWINTTGEFIFASYVKEMASTAAALNNQIDERSLITNYYSSYYTWINLFGFLMQTFLVSRLFRWIGIKGSLMILPIVMVIGYSLLAFLPFFAIARLTMIAENSTSYSIANTTRNALYLPLNREDKYLGKTTIDTFVWRLGDLFQFFVIYAGLNWLNWQNSQFVWLNLFLSLCMLLVCLKIMKLYHYHNEKSRDSNAPTLNRAAPSYELCAGEVLLAKLPEDLFFDPDPGDALKYALTNSDESPLPDWIEFDRHNLTITFSPPTGDTGETSLKLKVTDVDDLCCEAFIPVRWSSALN